jgi:hypothetical protein
MTAAAHPARVADLAFLVGAWHGEGTLRDAAVTCRSVCAPFGALFGDGMLTLDHVTSRGGAVVHRERILFRDEPGGGATCTTSPWRGAAQVWRIETTDPGRVWTLTHPGFLWTIRREAATAAGPSADAWSETFDRISADPRGELGAERIVSLRHLRDTAHDTLQDSAMAEVTP